MTAGYFSVRPQRGEKTFYYIKLSREVQAQNTVQGP